MIGRVITVRLLWMRSREYEDIEIDYTVSGPGIAWWLADRSAPVEFNKTEIKQIEAACLRDLDERRRLWSARPARAARG